jgi:hypothetical protein
LFSAFELSILIFLAADCFHGLIEFILTTARDEDVSTFSDEELCWLANPIPVVAPVMTATFPFNLPSGCGISFNIDIKEQPVQYQRTLSGTRQ